MDVTHAQRSKAPGGSEGRRTHLFDLLLLKDVASQIVSYLHESADVKRLVFQLHRHVTVLLVPRVQEVRFWLRRDENVAMDFALASRLEQLERLSVRTVGYGGTCSGVSCAVNRKMKRCALPPNLKSLRLEPCCGHIYKETPLQECLLETPLPGLQSLRFTFVTQTLCEILLRCESLHGSLRNLHLSFYFENDVENSLIQGVVDSFFALEQLVICTVISTPLSMWRISLSKMTRLQNLIVKSDNIKVAHFPPTVTRVKLFAAALKAAIEDVNEVIHLPALEEIVLEVHFDADSLLVFCRGAPNLRRCLLARRRRRYGRGVKVDAVRELLTLCPRLEAVDGNIVGVEPSILSHLRDRGVHILPRTSLYLGDDLSLQEVTQMPSATTIECLPQHLPYVALEACKQLTVFFGWAKASTYDFSSPRYANLVDLALKFTFGLQSKFDFSALRNLSSLVLKTRPLLQKGESIASWHRQLRDTIYSVSPTATSITVDISEANFSTRAEPASELIESAVDVRHMLQRYPYLDCLRLSCNVTGFDDAQQQQLHHKQLAVLEVAAWYGLSSALRTTQFQMMARNIQCNETGLPKLYRALVTFVFFNYTTSTQRLHFLETINHKDWIVAEDRQSTDSLKMSYCALLHINTIIKDQ